jgi:hypothetical protein
MAFPFTSPKPQASIQLLKGTISVAWSFFVCSAFVVTFLVRIGILTIIVFGSDPGSSIGAPTFNTVGSGPGKGLQLPGSSSWSGPKHDRSEGSEEEGFDHPFTKRGSQKNYREPRRKRQVACPFWKHNPIAYSDCLYRHTIYDLGQHLKVVHKQAIHCPTCGVKFSDPDSRNGHIRQRSCAPLPYFLEGVSEQNFHEIRNLAPGLQGEARWFAVWRILFPRSRQPNTCFISSIFDEVMGIARRACSHFGQQNPNLHIAFNGDNPFVNRPYPIWSQFSPLAQPHRDLSFLTSDFPIPMQAVPLPQTSAAVPAPAPTPIAASSSAPATAARPTLPNDCAPPHAAPANPDTNPTIVISPFTENHPYQRFPDANDVPTSEPGAGTQHIGGDSTVPPSEYPDPWDDMPFAGQLAEDETPNTSLHLLEDYLLQAGLLSGVENASGASEEPEPAENNVEDRV